MSSNPRQRSIANQPAIDNTSLILPLEMNSSDVPWIQWVVLEAASLTPPVVVTAAAIKGLWFFCSGAPNLIPLFLHAIPFNLRDGHIRVEPGENLYVPIASVPADGAPRELLYTTTLMPGPTVLASVVVFF